MPFVISKAAAVAAAVATAPIAQQPAVQVVYEQQCYYIPRQYNYYELACQYVAKPIQVK